MHHRILPKLVPGMQIVGASSDPTVSLTRFSYTIISYSNSRSSRHSTQSHKSVMHELKSESPGWPEIHALRKIGNVGVVHAANRVTRVHQWAGGRAGGRTDLRKERVNERDASLCIHTWIYVSMWRQKQANQRKKEGGVNL